MAERAQRAEGTAPPPPLPAVCIAGATASGKSRLALALASALEAQGRPAAIVNADALQVYRGLERLTDQPGPGAQRQARHELYGFLSPAEPSSAARWLAAAARVLAACRAEGRLPVFCGGTGLYFQALTRGLAPVPPVEADRRARLEARLAALGKAAFHAELAALDAAEAARVGPHNTARMVRARAVLEATGRPLPWWWARQREGQEEGEGADAGPSPGGGGALVRPLLQVVLLPPAEALRAPILARAQSVLGREGLEEARRLLAGDGDGAEQGEGAGQGGGRPPAAKALGVAEAEAVLAGRLAPNEAAEQLAARTRRYARRQRTWARSRLLDGPGRPLLLEQRFAPPDEAALLARVGESLALAEAEAGRANAGK